MDSQVVKLSSGEDLKVVGIKWKKVRELKLVSILNKYRGADNDVMIAEEDIDIVISAILPENKRDVLTFDDATKLFSAVMSTTFDSQDAKAGDNSK